VFVVGLSAGGAMAVALLACYPDVFSGGAVVAGLPVGAASGTTQALMRMAHPGPERPAAEWAGYVKAAGPANYDGPTPRISIWHGLADNVVDPANGDLLATQWSAVHKLPLAPNEDSKETVGRHRVWSKRGKPVMEQWIIPGMAHGYPIDAKTGTAGQFILDVGHSATRSIAGFWDLI
jgi:poly(3-hydroxybutyrate) depolymerase